MIGHALEIAAAVIGLLIGYWITVYFGIDAFWQVALVEIASAALGVAAVALLILGVGLLRRGSGKILP